MSGGWQGADYLSAGWVADEWLPKQAYVPAAGAWVNQKYLSRRWISDSWLYHIVASSGASIAVSNVPGVLLAALPGSARQTVRVNATTAHAPLAALIAVANAGNHATQPNLPSLGLASFDTVINGGIAQIASVTFTVEVASTFGYSKVVSATTAALPLAAVDTAVAIGTDVAVAADKVALGLAAFSTSVKANSSAQAVASVGVQLQAAACLVSIGRNIMADAVLAVPLATLQASVVTTENSQSSIHLTTARIDLAAYAATVRTGRGNILRAVTTSKRKSAIVTVRRSRNVGLASSN